MSKNITFLLLFLVVAELCSAQNLFTRVYGGDSYDTGAEVIQTSDGYLVAATTGSYGLESGQIMLLKADEEGYEQWRRFYGNQYADQAESMVESADANLLIAGTSEVEGNSYEFYAIKLTTEGDTLWTRTYGGTEWDFCKQAIALDDGGFALFGQSYNTGNGDYHLVRIDGNGDTLWTRSYGGSGLETGKSIAEAFDGGFYLAGSTESYGAGASDMYVVRTDEFGDTLWTKTFGGPLDDYCHAIAATEDSGYVLVGATFNNTADQSDLIIRKEGGVNTWSRLEATPGGSWATDVIVQPGTGDVTVVGVVDGGGDFGKQDGRILRYGGLDGIWGEVAKNHGSEGDDRFYDVKLCSDGGYVMAGFTEGYLDRFDDVWLVRADNFGFGVPAELGVDEIQLGGESFKVAIAPNPIEASSTLEIQNYEKLRRNVDGVLVARIFNAFGAEIKVVQVQSNATSLGIQGLAAGIYTYQLSTNKMVLATGKAVKFN